MQKNVSILNLGRKEIKAVIYNNAKDNIEVVYNQTEIQKVLNNVRIENPIIVYNPNVATQKEIKQMILKNLKMREGDKVNLEVSGEEFLKKILGLLTNIDLGLEEDNEENNTKIKEILDDPSEILKKVHSVTLDIFQSIGLELNETFETLSKLPKEEVEALSVGQSKKEGLGEVVNETEAIADVEVVEESEEEKLMKEYEAKLAELKNKLGK